MKNGKALGVLATALGMIILDGTIVAVALPDIIADLGLDLSDAQWVNASYSVIFAALLLTMGRLGDRFGRRNLLVAGIALFAIGSALAAAAGDPTTLISARLVQGIGGAAALPAALSTVTATFRGKDRGPAFAVWGVVASGSAAIGPLLGGWLTTAFTWPWIFLVNLPIAVFVIIGAYLWVPNTKQENLAPGLDIPGLLLSALGFSAIVYSLIEGQAMGWWKPATEVKLFGLVWPADAAISLVPILLALGVILVAGFIWWELRRARQKRSALLDLSLFTLPTFRWGNLTATAVAIGEFGIVFVMPLFLVNVLGLDTLKAGLVIAAMAIGAFFSGAMARHLAASIGAPRTVVVGLALEVVGTAATAMVVTAGVSAWLLAACLAVYGLGLGLASAQLTGTTLVDVPLEESGQGSAAQSTVRQLGSALGTAVVGAALAAALATSIPSALTGVAGLDSAAADKLATQTVQSAGGVIEQMRVHGTGEHPKEVVEALSSGFASATTAAVPG